MIVWELTVAEFEQTKDKEHLDENYKKMTLKNNVCSFLKENIGGEHMIDL